MKGRYQKSPEKRFSGQISNPWKAPAASAKQNGGKTGIPCMIFFFHPDFTVGSGFVPDQPHDAGRGLVCTCCGTTAASPPVGNYTQP